MNAHVLGEGAHVCMSGVDRGFYGIMKYKNYNIKLNGCIFLHKLAQKRLKVYDDDYIHY